MEAVTHFEHDDPVFIEAVKVLADTEARGVAGFLANWDLRSESDACGLIALPREFLLGVAVSLRFKIWELNHRTWHLAAGLPNSDEVLTTALLSVNREALGTMVNLLHVKSLQLFHDHYVWHAKATSQVDLVFENLLDDRHLDAIADFLWNNRHVLRAIGKTQ